MIFTACGDVLIQRHLPPDYEGFRAIRAWMDVCDVKYFNLETTINREGECFGSQFHGGSYVRIEPEMLEDYKRYGFNMVSFCNNHTMDFSYEGLLQTLDYVKASGLVHAGVGRNLSQAAAPAYLDAEGGRVALIGVASSCHETTMAGEQSRRVPGRPGINRLRHSQTLVVTPEQMDMLKQIGMQTQVNSAKEMDRAAGYLAPMAEEEYELGPLSFRVGEQASRETACNPKDLARVEKAIHEAKFQADYILIAIHSHEINGNSRETPAQFLEEFAHRCIDAGADAVIGHGPHLLRPLEIYKGKPIFYSLGDFVLQNECAPFSPEDYYEKYGLNSNATMPELYRVRSGGFTRGLQTMPVMFETVLPRWEMKDGTMVKLELLPVELGFGLPRSRNGLPAPAKDDTILHRLAAMSAPYGTKMEIKDGVAEVILG